MIIKVLKKIILFSKINFRLGLPEKNNLLLFDELHSSVLRKIIKKDFNILEVRSKNLYFWIYLKQIIFFDFSFRTYCKNYIKFTSPKVIITFNDARYQMYELKPFFKDIKFISIANGIRWERWFKINKKLWPKILSCDYIFVINKYFIPKYKKIIKSNYRLLGNFTNNNIKIKKTKFKKQFLFISQVHENPKVGRDHFMHNFHTKLLKLINLYLLHNNKKLHILLRRSNKNPWQKIEINFYKKILKSNCVFHQSIKLQKKYEIMDKFENIIFTFSTMGFEAISRKKKIAAFPPHKVNNLILPNKYLASKYYFGWPANYQKSYNFFSSKNLNINEVSRVLRNVNNCSQSKWNKKYYNMIKDQCYFDKNNDSIRKLILKLIRTKN